MISFVVAWLSPDSWMDLHQLAGYGCSGVDTVSPGLGLDWISLRKIHFALSHYRGVGKIASGAATDLDSFADITGQNN